ncbi:MAG TPA: two-component regulator propeller domain-containing protein, partial [Longilinea sp.]|nr:two-component regulator propeller domain-containing protein [Longilinea sp.]
SLIQTRPGNIWVGTWNGLSHYVPLSNSFANYSYNPAGEELEISSAFDHIQALTKDSHGYIWIGTNGGGMIRFNPLSDSFTPYHNDSNNRYSISNNVINDIFEADNGILWVATEAGLNQFDPESTRFVRYDYNSTDPNDPESISNPVVNVVYSDRSGVFWIGTEGGGLNQFNITAQRFLNVRQDSGQPYSISNSTTFSFFEDSNGYLWVGTYLGINRLFSEPNGFLQYTSEDDTSPYNLSNLTVYSIASDCYGRIWAGSSHGLFQYNQNSEQFALYPQVPWENVQSSSILSSTGISVIKPDNACGLWIGTQDAGLIYLDIPTETATIYRPQAYNTDSLSSLEVSTILVASGSEIWIGTESDGLDVFDPTTQKFAHFRNDPSDPNSLSNDAVNILFEDSQGRLWVGTDAGLNLYLPESNTFQHFSQMQGLPSDAIMSLEEDNQGILWISTNAGIARFNPETLESTTFDLQDGLQGNDFNQGASFKDQNGLLYFGGMNGYTRFNPIDLSANTYVPPIQLTHLTQGGVELFTPLALPMAQEVTLYWPRNYFEFSFASLNFIQSDNNNYAYRLEPFESDWNEVGDNPYGRYTNLPGGLYTLHIIGSNNDGVWNDTGFSFIIRVIPPIWDTTLFRWAFGLTVVLFLASIFFLRVTTVQRNNRELARQVKSRTQEAQRRRLAAESLRDVLALINSNHPLGDCLELIARQVALLMEADWAVVCCISPDHLGQVIISKGGNSVGIPPDLELRRWMLVVIESDRQNMSSEERECIPPDGLPNNAGWVCLPVQQAGEPVGILLVTFTSTHHLSEEDNQILESFADQAALAVGNSRLRTQSEEMAVASERNRLARDLHDAVTQSLFSASLLAEALPDLWETNQAEGTKTLQTLQTLNRGALAEMRSLLMELRPAALAESRLSDLLRQLAEAAAARTGMVIKMDLSEPSSLPPEVQVSLYRLAQEAVSNVVRHAHAKELRLALYSRESRMKSNRRVIMEICDNGKGFNTDENLPGHFGLKDIQ